MRWIFQRGAGRLTYEIGRTRAHGPYSLTVTRPDGVRLIDERFRDPYALHDRALRVERLLVRCGWIAPYLSPHLSHASPGTWRQN
jgi:hypothetical protein